MFLKSLYFTAVEILRHSVLAFSVADEKSGINLICTTFWVTGFWTLKFFEISLFQLFSSFLRRSRDMGLLSFILSETTKTFYMKTCVTISENYPFIISFRIKISPEKYLLYHISPSYFLLVLSFWDTY